MWIVECRGWFIGGWDGKRPTRWVRQRKAAHRFEQHEDAKWASIQFGDARFGDGA